MMPHCQQLRHRVRAHTPLWLLLALFLLLIIFIDRDRPNIVLDIYCYALLIGAFLTLHPADVWTLSRSWILRICFGYLLFMWLTPLWTSGIGQAQWRAVALASLFIVWFVTMTAHLVLSRGEHVDWLLRILGWAAVATGLYSILAYFSVHDFSERLIIAPWPNPNTGAAVFGLLAVGIAAGLMSTPKMPVAGRAVYATLVVTLSLCVLLAGTRSALLGMAASAAGCFLLSSRMNRRSYLAAGILCAIGGIIVYTTQATIFRGDGGRLELLSSYWDIALERFWLGHGIQNEFKFVVMQQGQAMNSPHNMLLTSLLYGGVIAMIGMAALYLATIFVAARYYRSGGTLAVAAIGIYLLVHGMFETIAMTSPGLSSPGWRWLYLWWPIGLAAGLELRMKLRLPPGDEKTLMPILIGLSLRAGGDRRWSTLSLLGLQVKLPRT
jgi:hypothetical protein